MDISIGINILMALLFGVVFSGLRRLIEGWNGWRPWLGEAVVLAGLCYIILFGAIKV